ncbi:hypothetical protein GOOTI_132_00260 [Gordonia otitidis NBRC 100426]|uniref:TVP38/TMEM64 family membrane protein n=1 Tax=Gordonia otitidis (strain DSM 44809 / CCUG 52243 / JCM 12355 / NBRC 100426 / IFM 10032) TaxID=1108044 RepID=H5TNG7_GORO1|nr:hypothetical protein GOOTI_132_00260 [Gordonia otitidis NBRC 100426]
MVRNAVIAFGAVCVLLAVSYLVPIPTVAHVRSWGENLGPVFVWVFFTAYALLTVFPIPRTVFTVSAGALFGPVVGLVGALIATAIAATLGFLLARWAGRDRVTPFLHRPVVITIDNRLAARGWLAIGSLRLIPVCPFWLLNWCAGLSSVRLLPYLVASVVASAPGTVAVVLLGDALTGQRNPLLILLSGTFFAVGVVGLILDVRLPVRRQADAD